MWLIKYYTPFLQSSIFLCTFALDPGQGLLLKTKQGDEVSLSFGKTLCTHFRRPVEICAIMQARFKGKKIFQVQIHVNGEHEFPGRLVQSPDQKEILVVPCYQFAGKNLQKNTDISLHGTPMLQDLTTSM